MVKRWVWFVPAAAVMVMAGACTSDEGGTALPTVGGTASNGPSSQLPSETSSSGAGEPAASIDPCALLSSTELAEFGEFEGPKDSGLKSVRACDWQTPVGADESLVIGVGVRDDQGVNDANDTGMGVDRTQANGRDIVRVPSQGAHCLIALGIAESSRVDVDVTAGDTDRACEIADKVAGIVEPKLPDVS